MSKRSLRNGESHSLQEQSSKISKTRTTTIQLQPENENEEENDEQQQQQQLMSIQAMLEWLQNRVGGGDADLSKIRVALSKEGGGFGAFAISEIPSNGIIARIPNQAVMSVRRSKEQSCVGRFICREANLRLNEQPCDEFLLWLDMVHGRRDPNHFHHLYLASLPAEAPDVPSWSPKRRLRLQGTNLGHAAAHASHELHNQYHQWMPQLVSYDKGNPELFGSMTLDDLVWARGMYFSRRFPAILLHEQEEEEAAADAEVEATNEPDTGSLQGTVELNSSSTIESVKNGSRNGQRVPIGCTYVSHGSYHVKQCKHTPLFHRDGGRLR